MGLPAQKSSASNTAHLNLPSRKGLLPSCGKSSQHTACRWRLLPGQPPLQSPSPHQSRALPRAACSGRGRRRYDSHSSPMQDNSDKPGLKGPSQVDFRLCSVPSPHSSCLVPVKCLHCSPACRDPGLKHTHGHSQSADLVPQALATLADSQRQMRSKGGK